MCVCGVCVVCVCGVCVWCVCGVCVCGRDRGCFCVWMVPQRACLSPHLPAGPFLSLSGFEPVSLIPPPSTKTRPHLVEQPVPPERHRLAVAPRLGVALPEALDRRHEVRRALGAQRAADLVKRLRLLLVLFRVVVCVLCVLCVCG